MKMKSANGGSIEIKCGSSGEVVDVRREGEEKSETQQRVKAEIVTKNGGVYTNVHTIVVCAGGNSKEIARMCGDGDIPLIAERGYSVEFPDTEQVSPSKLLTRRRVSNEVASSSLRCSPTSVAGHSIRPNQPPTASFLLLETTTHKLLWNLSKTTAASRNPSSDWLGSHFTGLSSSAEAPRKQTLYTPSATNTSVSP